MRLSASILFAVLAAGSLSPAAYAANMCQAETLSCATTMPVGGYCECTKGGVTKGGTVMAQSPSRPNSTAGGCGARPNAPGCR